MRTDVSGTSLDEVVRTYGEWTAMSIHLGNGQYTPMPIRTDKRLTRFLQIAADLAGKPLSEMRVLDLGCLEGHYAIEFGLHGATAVGVEVREANIAKARFVQRHLGLTNVTFRQDDVRNLRPETYGTYDLVLCAGILYHLDAPAVFDFVRAIHSVCDRLAIFDTLIALKPQTAFDDGGDTYWGLRHVEHQEDASEKEKARDLWASIDNVQSAWLTHASLCNLMTRVGFTSFYECHTPSLVDQFLDRKTYVAIKGTVVSVHSSPVTAALAEEPWPEQRPWRISPSQLEHGRLWYAAKAILPQGVKDAIKPTLRRLRLMAPDVASEWVTRHEVNSKEVE